MPCGCGGDGGDGGYAKRGRAATNGAAVTGLREDSRSGSGGDSDGGGGGEGGEGGGGACIAFFSCRPRVVCRGGCGGERMVGLERVCSATGARASPMAAVGVSRPADVGVVAAGSSVAPSKGSFGCG